MARLNRETGDAQPSDQGPIVFTQTVTERKGLPKRGTQPNAAFLYLFHPERWGWNDAAEAFLPRPKQMSLLPGASGMGAGKGPGQVTNEDDAIARWSKLGWDLLHPDDPRLGRWTGYCAGHRLERGGIQWMPKWVQPRVVGKRVRWVPDEDEHRAFLAHVVEKNLIAPMDEIIRNELVGKQQRRLTTIENDYLATPNALIASRLQRERVKLAKMRGEDVMQAEAEALERVKILEQQAKEAQKTVGAPANASGGDA